MGAGWEPRARRIARHALRAFGRRLAGPVAAALLLAACGDDGAERGGPAPDPALAKLSGQELAGRFCQGCHLLPDPAGLDRDTWATQVLPRMGYRLGIYPRPGMREDSLFEPGPGSSYVLQADVFPESPRLPESAWKKLVAYYVQNAPASLPEPPARPAPRVGLRHFRVRPGAFRADPPMTTLVAIDSVHGRIYLGDTKQDFSTLEVLDASGRSLQSVGMESAPAHVRLRGDTAEVVLMGRLLPTDNPEGMVRAIFRGSGTAEYSGASRLLEGLFRPVHVSYADLSGDGREDLVVSEFGNLVGRLAWYRWTGPSNYQIHVLRPLPGAVGTRVRDVDGDGDRDLIALVAQGEEGFYLYRNQGNGEFREERLLRLPPWYGSSSFEVLDFDGDGDFDLLHTSGDNGDYRPVAKPYHGVRIFLNDGGTGFREAYFYPFHGAYGLRARDFDRDGDLDIAAVAFYPDYRRPPATGFVYLENRGGMRFEASTFAGEGMGRWITLDAGDLDRDGDADLVLGSFVAFDPVGDQTGLHQRWLRESPSLVILENTTR